MTRTAAERRLGLFLAVSCAYYDGRKEHGEHVSQSDRFGDTITNGDATTTSTARAATPSPPSPPPLSCSATRATGRQRRGRLPRRDTRGPTRTTCRT
eukprot:921138-Prymnesium_polylepis.1